MEMKQTFNTPPFMVCPECDGFGVVGFFKKPCRPCKGMGGVPDWESAYKAADEDATVLAQTASALAVENQRLRCEAERLLRKVAERTVTHAEFEAMWQTRGVV